LQRRSVGRYGFPEFAQLGVVRIGNVLLATLPWEVTTVAGLRMKRAIMEVAPPGIQHVGILSLSNGYLSYLTTAEEYSAQHYEGASNLFGPRTAEMVTNQIAALASTLDSDAPKMDVQPVVVRPGRHRSFFAMASWGRVPEERVFNSVNCEDNKLVASWIDASPGPLLPADGPILRIESRHADLGTTTAAEDDHRSVVIRAVRPERTGHLWQVAWRPDFNIEGEYRVLLESGTRRSTAFREHASRWVRCSAR
jgi:neutral ceramidase